MPVVKSRHNRSKELRMAIWIQTMPNDLLDAILQMGSYGALAGHCYFTFRKVAKVLKI